MSTKASDFIPGLAEMVALEGEMLAAGKSGAEVDEFFDGCRRYAFDEETRRLLAEGVPLLEVQRRWVDLAYTMPQDLPESADDGDL